MTKQINRAELQARILANPNLVLIEALPEKYYRDGHLPLAKHMPHDQVKQLAPAILPDQLAEIVTYCASNTCQNSHTVANLLSQIGYINVSVYTGGKKDWMEADLPLEQTDS
jgi:rhodanese-related sulfurtransferase